MLHPESKYAKFREIEEKKSKLPLRERIVKSINLLIGWVNEPGKDERKDRVRIYCFDWYPTYSIVRSDNIMYVSNYLFCDTGDFAPTLILSNTGEDSPFNTYIENLRLLINAGVAKLVKR